MSRPLLETCTLEYVEQLREYTADEVWSVDSHGERVEFFHTTDDAYYTGNVVYTCTNCQRTWENWEEVKAHLDSTE